MPKSLAEALEESKSQGVYGKWNADYIDSHAVDPDDLPDWVEAKKPQPEPTTLEKIQNLGAEVGEKVNEVSGEIVDTFRDRTDAATEQAQQDYTNYQNDTPAQPVGLSGMVNAVKNTSLSDIGNAIADANNSRAQEYQEQLDDFQNPVQAPQGIENNWLANAPGAAADSFLNAGLLGSTYGPKVRQKLAFTADFVRSTELYNNFNFMWGTPEKNHLSEELGRAFGVDSAIFFNDRDAYINGARLLANFKTDSRLGNDVDRNDPEAFRQYLQEYYPAIAGNNTPDTFADKLKNAADVKQISSFFRIRQLVYDVWANTAERNDIYRNAYVERRYLTDEEVERAQALSNRLNELNKKIPQITEHPLYGVLTQTAVQFAGMGTDSAVGAVAAGVAGLGVLGATGNAAAARTAAGYGFKVGSMAGMFARQVGEKYIEYLSYQNKDDTRTLTPNQAALAATIETGVETGIEFWNFNEIMRTMGGKDRAAIQDIVRENHGNAEAIRGGLKAYLTNSVKAWAPRVKEEVLEEAYQSATSDITHNAIVTLHPETKEQYIPLADITANSVDAMVQAVPSVVGMIAGGDIISNIRMVRNMASIYELHKNMTEEEIDNAELNSILKDVQENQKTSKLAKENPRAYMQVLKTEADKAGIPNVYVDTEMLMKEPGGREVLEKLGEQSGYTKDQVQETINSKGDLEVPTSVFCQVALPSAVGDKVIDMATSSPDINSQARVKDTINRITRTAKALAEQDEKEIKEIIPTIVENNFQSDEERQLATEIISKDPGHINKAYQDTVKDTERELNDILQGTIDIEEADSKEGDTVAHTIRNENLYNGQITTTKGAKRRSQFWTDYFGSKTPTQAQKRQYAYDVLTGAVKGGPRSLGVAYDMAMQNGDAKEASQIKAEMQANKAKLDGLQHNLDVLKGMKDKLGSIPSIETTITRGLTPEGYRVYRAANSFLDASTNDKVRKQARMGAILFARECESLAREMTAQGNKSTAEDVAKMLNVNPSAHETDAVRNAYNQMAGVNALTANFETLKKAEAMEKAGADQDKIWKETGWTKGLDNQWRFEIPDDLDAVSDMIKEPAEYPLHVLYDNENLYKAYPQFKGIHVRITDGKNANKGTGGWYDRSNNTIVLIPGHHDSELELKKSLIHEIQHLIQTVENFASGGNPRTARKAVLQASEDTLSFLDKYIGNDKFKVLDEAIGKILNRPGKNGGVSLQDFMDADAEQQRQLEKIHRETGVDVDEIQHLREVYDRANRMKKAAENDLDFDLYRNLGGEQEARETEARAEERSMQTFSKLDKESLKEAQTRYEQMPHEERTKADHLLELLLKAGEQARSGDDIGELAAASEAFNTGNKGSKEISDNNPLVPQDVREEVDKLPNPVASALYWYAYCADVVRQDEQTLQDYDKNAPRPKVHDPFNSLIVFNQTAWHGSPYNFDKFTLEHIGGGEGNQVHGYGLYFAKRKSVSKAYKDMFTEEKGNNSRLYKVDVPNDKDLLDEDKPYAKQSKSIKERLQKAYDGLTDEQKTEFAKRLLPSTNYSKEELETNDRVKTFEAVIRNLENLSQDHGEIPKFRRNILAQLFAKLGYTQKDVDNYISNKTEAAAELEKLKRNTAEELDALKSQARALAESREQRDADKRNLIFAIMDANPTLDRYSGREIYNAFQMALGTPKDASEQLNQNGIKGITYNGGSDGRCFVIFDDKAISIIEKFNQERAEIQGQTAAGENKKSYTVVGDEDVDFEPDPDKSYRFTSRDNPLSDWDSAMFADNAESVTMYGKQAWSVNHSDLIDIDDLMPIIKEELHKEFESGEIYNHFGGYAIDDDDEEKTVNQIADSFAPKDIVETAQGYDNDEAVQWLWDKIAEPRDIKGIKTPDGAFVFDTSIIHPENDATIFYAQVGDEVTLFNQERARIQGQTAFAKGSALISLFEAADQSTFMHETAHFYLKEMQELANNENATDQFKKDFMVIQNWVGNKKLTDELTTEQHEKFARGFESYLRNGKAPAPQLKSVFNRFKNWLTRLYRDFKELGGKPPEDVMRVMDRMLATQDEIDRAMKEQMVDDFKRAGGLKTMNGENARTWERWYQKVREEAEAKVMAQAMKDLTEADQKDIQEAIDTQRQITLEEMKRDPFWIADEAYRTTGDESILATFNLTPQEYTDELKKRGGSMKAALDSRMQGFEKEMRESAKSTDNIAEEAKKAVQSSEYQEMLHALEYEALTQKAREYVRQQDEKARKAQDKQDRQTARENAKAEADAEKARKVGEKLTMQEEKRNAKVKAAQAEVEGVRKGMRIVRDTVLKTLQERRAAAKAAMAKLPINQATNVALWARKLGQKQNDVYNYMTRGRWDLAAAAKQDQLMMAAMVTESGRLKMQIDRQAANIQKRIQVLQKGTERMPTQARFWYQHIAYVLGLSRGDGLNPAEGAKSLQDVFNEMTGLDQNGAPEVLVPQWLNSMANQTGRIGMGKLSPDQWSKAVEIMKALYKMGMDKDRLHVVSADGVNPTISETAQALAANMFEHNGRHPQEDVRSENTFLDKRRQNLRDAKEYTGSFFTKLINPLTVMQRMDGYEGKVGRSRAGMAIKTLYDPVERATNEEIKLMAAFAEGLKNAFGKYTGEELDDLHNKRIYRFGDRLLTKEEIMCLALTSGTESGYKRILDNEVIGDQEFPSLVRREAAVADALQDALSNLDERDWNTVTAVWNLMGSHYADESGVKERTTGIPLGKLKHRQFSVTGKDGKAYMLQGGYYPVAYDASKTARASDLETQDALRSMAPGNMRMGQGKGFTKNRERIVTGRPLKLSFDTISNKGAEMMHYIAFRETALDVNHIINNRGFAQAIVDSMGMDEYHILQQWASDIWQAPKESQAVLDRIVRSVRTKTTSAVLAYRTSTMLLNAANASLMAEHVGAANFLDYVRKFYSEPEKNWRFVNGISPFMAERSERMDTNLREAMEKSQLKVKGKSGNPVLHGIQSIHEAIMDNGFKLIGLTDNMFAYPLWYGSYIQTLNEELQAGKTNAEAQKQAIAAGDRAVIRVIGSGEMKDLSQFQKGSELARTLTMFYSFQNALYNMLANKYYAGVQNAELAGKIGWRRFTSPEFIAPMAHHLLVGVMMGAAVETAIRGAMDAMSGGDDNKKKDAAYWLTRYAETAAGNQLATIPLVRDIWRPVSQAIFYPKEPFSLQKDRAKMTSAYDAFIQMANAGVTLRGATLDKKGMADIVREGGRAINRMTGSPDMLTDGVANAIDYFTSPEQDRDIKIFIGKTLMDKKYPKNPHPKKKKNAAKKRKKKVVK